MDSVETTGTHAPDAAESTNTCATDASDSSGNCAAEGVAGQGLDTPDGSKTVAPGNLDGQEAGLLLPRLLAEAEALFAAEFDHRLRTSEFASVSLAHARNVLRHLGQEPRRASAIVADCGVSKQALSQQIALLEHDGLLTVQPDPADARARLLTLSTRGVRAQQLVGRLFHEIEDEWATEIGADDLAALRRVLGALAARRRTRAC